MNQLSSLHGLSARIRFKVLLVDEDAAVLRSLVAALEFDFDVVPCSSALRALSLLESGEFHAVCCDYAMPGMSGVELFERVAQLPFNIACLLLTGASSFLGGQSSLDHYVLTKPVDPTRLSTLLMRLAQTAQLKRHADRLRAAR